MWTAIIISLLGILIDIQSVGAVTCRYTYTSGYLSYTRYYSCYSSQYCCGTRSCCYYSSSSGGVYSLWYFWFGIIMFIVICSGASGAYYKKRQRIIVRTNPAPVAVQTRTAQQTMIVSATASSGYAGYPAAPPPAYNQAVATTGPSMGVASYPTGYSMPPPVQYSNAQGVSVQHY